MNYIEQESLLKETEELGEYGQTESEPWAELL